MKYILPLLLIPMLLFSTEIQSNEHYFGNQNGFVAFHYALNKQASFSIYFWGHPPAHIPLENLVKSEESLVDGTIIHVYRYDYPSSCYGCAEARCNLNEPIFLDPKTQSYRCDLPIWRNQRIEKEAHPLNVSTLEAAALIQNRSVAIICGPGVDIHAGVLSRAGFRASWSPAPEEDIFAVASQMLKDPQALLDAFIKRCDIAFYAPPTAVHESIAQIAQRKNASILNANFGTLLERTGAKVFSIWSEEDIEKLLKVLDFPELVLTIGLGRDHKGILQAYKSQFPEGKILAINYEQPIYLDDRDYWLRGDLEKLTPLLASIIGETSVDLR
jgi:hypothetical protein